MRRTRVSIVFVGLCSLTALATSAWAQSSQRPDPLKAPPERQRDPEWTVELRGGFAAQTTPSTGTGQLPAAGATLAATPTSSSRVVSSWLFGDGSALWNSVFPGTPLRPLDDVLESVAARRPPGAGVGFTLSKRNFEHWATDLNVDVAVAQMGFTSAAQAGVQATRQSYATAFGTAFRFFNPIIGTAVTGPSTAGREAQITIAESYRLPEFAAWKPFVSVGGGVVLDTQGPVMTIGATSSLSTTLPSGTSLYVQSDSLTIHANDDHFRWAGLLGAGVERALSARGGVRFTLRVGLTRTTLGTSLDATPISAGGGPTLGIAFTNGTAHAVLISNGLLPPSSLSGPRITAFQTFTASALTVETTVSAGYYVRF